MNKKIKKIGMAVLRQNAFLREKVVAFKLSIDKKKYKKFYKKYSVDDKLCIFEAFNGRKYCDS